MSERYTIDLKYLQLMDELLLDKNVKNKIKQALNNNRIIKNGYGTNKYFIDLSEEDVETMLNELSTLFISKGLQMNDEPNRLGLSIEELIDIITSF